MIRAATFSDIPRLFELMQEMHQRSRYAALSALDEKLTKATFMQSIQRHGGKTSGGTLVMVAEKDGTVEAFIIGILAPIYEVGVKLQATDYLFYASDKSSPRAAGKLLDSVIAWADENPRVKVQFYGVNDAIGDFTRAARLFTRRGFRLAGAIYEREAA